MVVDELYKNFVEQVRTIYAEREAHNIADWVFESIAGIRKPDRITNKINQIDNSKIQKLDDSLQQLLQNKPVQYVLGEVWFYKMKLKVDEHVLIPRPETEELVEWIIQETGNKKPEIRKKKGSEVTTGDYQHETSHLRILDIGTGSGCIAIALKKELPDAEILAIDVSKEAVGVALQNALDHNAEIEFKHIDFLDEDLWASYPLFQIIVSNPPYIPEQEKIKLSKNVVEHEPHVALFVTDDDPIIFYRKIAAFADQKLQKTGKIFVEVHEAYSGKVQQLFEDQNFITEGKKDIYGRERMVKAFRISDPVIL